MRWNAHRCAYVVVGSIASIAYGESRFTQDIDIVAAFELRHVDQLLAAFPSSEFYLSEAAMRDAIRTSFQFNVIHPGSGNKIDFILPREDEWSRVQMARARRVRLLPDRDVMTAAPEDVILGKLWYYSLGGGDRHLRDIAGILRVTGNGVDRAEVEALGCSTRLHGNLAADRGEGRCSRFAARSGKSLKGCSSPGDLHGDSVDVGEIEPAALAPGFQIGGFELLFGLVGIVLADGVAVMVQPRLVTAKQRQEEVVATAAEEAVLFTALSDDLEPQVLDVPVTRLRDTGDVQGDMIEPGRLEGRRPCIALAASAARAVAANAAPSPIK